MSVQAMQMALEALQDAKMYGAGNWSHIEEALTAALAQEAGQQPLFWVRLRSDGLYEGPIHDASIEEVRKKSGAWTPLFTTPPTLASAIERTIEAAAKVCEETNVIPLPCGYDNGQRTLDSAADAIRALSPAQVLAATQTTTED